MKKIILLATIILASCSDKQIHSDEENSKTDSLLQKSDSAIAKSHVVHKVLDSVSTAVVAKTGERFDSLCNEVNSYRSEVVKKVKSQKVIYKVDTVYIEKKKNFWGKEKTKITTQGDSITTQTTDTTNEY